MHVITAYNRVIRPLHIQVHVLQVFLWSDVLLILVQLLDVLLIRMPDVWLTTVVGVTLCFMTKMKTN